MAAVLPPVMLLLLFLRRCCSLQGTPSEDPGFPPVEYYEGEDMWTSAPTEVAPSDGRRLQRCDYSPCLEGQPPCEDLAASLGCLCPGFTLHTVAPQAPDIKSVRWNGSEVVVRWCAPYSVVSAYVVTVGGELRRRFGTEKRSGTLGNIQGPSEVCVLAVNEAGPGRGSCTSFNPRGRGLPLTAGLVGGGLGLLLLVLLATLLWRHRKQRKQEANISRLDPTEGL